MSTIYPTIYTNPDGLTMLFGTDQALPVNVGSPQQAGTRQVIEATFAFNLLEPFGTTTNIDPLFHCAIPMGAIITSANWVVESGFTSGGSATISIGLCKGDGSVISTTAIDSAIAVASVANVGTVITSAGSYIASAALLYPSYLTVTIGTANLTAGKAVLTVNYILPANQ